MSSFTKNIIMAAALSMASAVQIQTEDYFRGCPDEPIGEGKWSKDEIIFDGCDQSYMQEGGIYEMSLYCHGNLVIKKHEDGKVFDLKSYKIEADGEIDRMIMQYDGNLVIYNKDNGPMWSTGTFGNHSANLHLQDDGNLVIYDVRAGGCKLSNMALWASDTSLPAQRYDYWWTHGEKLIEECGGLLQHSQGHPNKGQDEQFMIKMNCGSRKLELLASNNQDRTASGYRNWKVYKSYELDRAGPDAQPDHLIMQDDGNLVVYGTKGESMWASDTFGNDGAFVEFNDDGNLTMYSPGRTSQIWESGAWQPPAQQSGNQYQQTRTQTDYRKKRRNDPYCKKHYRPRDACIMSV